MDVLKDLSVIESDLAEYVEVMHQYEDRLVGIKGQVGKIHGWMDRYSLAIDRKGIAMVVLHVNAQSLCAFSP